MHEQFSHVLQEKIAHVEADVERVERNAKQVGSAEGPSRFNMLLPLSPLDTLSRIKDIGVVRRNIRTVTIPALTRVWEEAVETLEQGQRVHDDIEVIREFAAHGDILPAELEEAEKQAGLFFSSVLPKQELRKPSIQPETPFQKDSEIASFLSKIDPSVSTACTDFLQSSVASDMFAKVPQPMSSEFDNHFAGKLFEEVGYQWMKQRINGNDVLLSPSEVFHIYHALYPQRDIIDRQGLCYGLEGVSFPDGLIIRSENGSLTICGLVEYKNVTNGQSARRVDHINQQAKSFTPQSLIRGLWLETNGSRVIADCVRTYVPGASGKRVTIDPSFTTYFVIPENGNIDVPGVEIIHMPIQTTLLGRFKKLLYKAIEAKEIQGNVS